MSVETKPADKRPHENLLRGAAGPLLAVAVGVVAGSDRPSQFGPLSQIDLSAMLMLPAWAISLAVGGWQLRRPGVRKVLTGVFWFLGLVLGTVLSAALLLGGALLLWVK